jgi:hypothetical protein
MSPERQNKYDVYEIVGFAVVVVSIVVVIGLLFFTS